MEGRFLGGVCIGQEGVSKVIEKIINVDVGEARNNVPYIMQLPASSQNKRLRTRISTLCQTADRIAVNRRLIPAGYHILSSIFLSLSSFRGHNS